MSGIDGSVVLLGQGNANDGRFGVRASRLAELVNFGIPVPATIALSIEAVRMIASGHAPDTEKILDPFGPETLVSVRSSPGGIDWGGAPTFHAVGLNCAIHEELCNAHDPEAASKLYFDFIKSYAVRVARLDPEEFEALTASCPDVFGRLARAKSLYAKCTGESFPQDMGVQLTHVLRSMVRAWEGPTAHLLRSAHGAPENAGLGLLVQKTVVATKSGEGDNGFGAVSGADPESGSRGLFGNFCPGCISVARVEMPESSIKKLSPRSSSDLEKHLDLLRRRKQDELEIDFAVANGKVWVLDARPIDCSVQAAIQIAVDLAESGLISKESSLGRLEPDSIARILHPQVDRSRAYNVIATGISASPGAASGAVAFSSQAAAEYAARNESCILVRIETGPEDIKGMHFASGVLTGRGGITSHAAVVARGLGVPCVAGASDIQFDARMQALISPGGKIFREGDSISIDGTRGEVLEGAVPLEKPGLSDAFRIFLDWADESRDMEVRANADTPDEVQVANSFKADGIGLCRTEHMFFDEARLTVMREMIFADSDSERRATLKQLLPMQRSDFIELFLNMQGRPVCIRLFDPPLHEFLPRERDEIKELADALDLPDSRIIARMDELREFNPMLGMRGVRLGITVPEIYEMQARAIFEALVEARRRGHPGTPEIMIPLVSANREVELVKSSVDAVAHTVRKETGETFDYKIGVIVETPRAAIRAGDLAANSSFLSFGTNDLTQMTYGISRDDSQRFMATYVARGVYPEDPFATLDKEGVGELLLLAAKRGREANPDLVLSICGEHGGDAATIEFCRKAGFNYVSCSPFRVPIARLAAAQSAIRNRSDFRR